MRQNDLVEGVALFVTVARAESFSAAARQLGVSPSAVSQAISAIEGRLGTSLFYRSTRSLSLTDVGKDYLAVVAPALEQLRQAADDASGRAGRPAGPLRLTMPRAPFQLLIADALVEFQDMYPDIELEIAVEARFIDIVKQGYDAGLRYGNCLEKDMVAIPLAPRSEAILVAAPDYLDAHGIPARPGDLIEHRAIMCRSQLTGLVIPWTLLAENERVQITPSKTTIVHDLASQVELAIRGAGILSAPATHVANLLTDQTLVRVLPGWSMPMEELYLYCCRDRHRSAALSALISFLRTRASRSAR